MVVFLLPLQGVATLGCAPRASEAPRGGTKGKSRGTNQCAQTIMHVTEPGFTLAFDMDGIKDLFK